jgi:hypothetical protein
MVSEAEVQHLDQTEASYSRPVVLLQRKQIPKLKGWSLHDLKVGLDVMAKNSCPCREPNSSRIDFIHPFDWATDSVICY